MELNAICAEFGLSGATDFKVFGCGHINNTYRFIADGEKYVLQRINTNVFRDPDGLMDNILRVTAYLRPVIEARGGDVARGTLYMMSTRSGKPYFRDDEGVCWRVYPFVDHVTSYESVENPAVFAESARGFAQFQRDLANFPANELHETSPHFHDTPSRFRDLMTAAKADRAGRAASVADELAFAQAREADCAMITDAIAAGTVPIRVTHNDTKLNNVLIDTETHKAVCVVDLDTIMPGSALYDFGDSIRFGASTAAEDEPDLSRVWMDETLFEAYTRGYLEIVGDCLTETEIALLPMSAKLMTLECGMRFLADYLNGDIYFRTAYPTQNLDRARTQFKLVADMEAKMDKMAAIVQKYI